MKFTTFVMVLMAAVLLTSILETEAMTSFRTRAKAKRIPEEVREACDGMPTDCRGQPKGTPCCRNGQCKGGVCYF
uniref:Conotoxin-like unassigned superfamily 10 n=1 Tax=Conus ermineus TaxID=55423 RepID=A0A346CJ57_CONER|nr:conotoxin-like precursor unassigned superfamily 10 [Conus ermineus]